MGLLARQRARLAALLVSVLAAGCSGLLGVDSWEAAPGSGGSGASGAGAAGGSGSSAGGGTVECDAECAPAPCVDGVCCDGPCDGLCFACVEAKTGAPDGVCARVLEGTDPDDECTMPGGDVCGPTTGTCRCADGQQNGGETGVDCGGSCVECGSVETACVDAMDDDGDTQVDCDDPDCSDLAACLPSIPAGWTVGAFYLGAAAPPSCPGTFSMELTSGGVGVVSPPASCAPCTCSAPTLQACDTTVPVTAYVGVGCSNPTQSGNVMVDICNDVNPDVNNVKSVNVGVVQGIGGSCQASGGDIIDVPAATFAQNARFCTAQTLSQTNGCGACVLSPPGPFGSKPCIAQAGDLQCPPGFGSAVVLHTTIDDDRACGPCACGSPVGGSCAASLDISDGDGCTSKNTTVPADGTCHDLPTQTIASVMLKTTGVAVGGSCGPSGGLPEGGASGATPFTVCCP